MKENDEVISACANTKQAFDDCGSRKRHSMPLTEVEKTMNVTDFMSHHESGRYSSACVSCFILTTWWFDLIFK